MRVMIDMDLCEGNARCVAVAPEIFELTDDDQARVLVDPIPEDLFAKAEEAVRLCPRQAITLEE